MARNKGGKPPAAVIGFQKPALVINDDVDYGTPPAAQQGNIVLDPGEDLENDDDDGYEDDDLDNESGDEGGGGASREPAHPGSLDPARLGSVLA